MAIRFRPDRKTPYLVYWVNPFTSRIESRSFVTEKEAAAHDDKMRWRLKHDRESFHPPMVPAIDTPGGLTFDQLYVLYLREKKFAGKNAATQLRNLKEFFTAFGARPVAEITKAEVKEIMAAMKDRGCTQGTVYVRVRHFLAVLNWAAEEEIIPQSPVPHLRCPRGTTEVIPPPTTEELEAIYLAAPLHLKRAMLISVTTGLRVGAVELMGIRWSSFNLKKGILRITNAKKGNRSRRVDLTRDVPLKPHIIPVFARWRADDAEQSLDHDFVLHWRGKPITSFRTAWERAKKQAGITRRIRPYDMRHFFITEAISGGADLKTVATLAGHADVQMILRHYQHVQAKQKQEAIDLVPNLFEDDLVISSGHILGGNIHGFRTDKE